VGENLPFSWICRPFLRASAPMEAQLASIQGIMRLSNNVQIRLTDPLGTSDVMGLIRSDRSGLNASISSQVYRFSEELARKRIRKYHVTHINTRWFTYSFSERFKP
jgi:hypothetical protein